MFRKPFHVKTNVAMKGSEKRKLKSSVLQQFEEITSDQVDAIFPSKAQVTSMKIQTHAGDHVIIHCVDRVPAFFENERVLYPTVYTLWRYPALLPCLTTWPAVLEKMLGGADLMLPGVVVPSKGLPHLEKSQMCSVNVVGNLAPVAMGISAMSSEGMQANSMKGKGILTLHCVGDHLWEAGDKSTPPQINPPTESPPSLESGTTCDTGQESIPADAEDAWTSSELAEGGGEKEETRTGEEDGGGGGGGGEGGIEGDVAGLSIQSEGAVGGEEEKEEVSPTVATDELLYQCLLHSLKRKVKPADLPLLTSTLYRNYILSCCPEGKTLDIKKSSYKKLSRFLQAMQERGLLTVEQMSMGVDSVVTVHKDHPDIRSFVPPDGCNEAADQTAVGSSHQASGPKAPSGPPEIKQFFSPNQNQMPVLQPLGIQRGTWMTKKQVREAVTSYVKNESLVDQRNFAMVTLDPLLHDAVVNKSEASITQLKWDQLFTRFLHKMNPGYQIIFPGDSTSSTHVHKGAVQPIKLKKERKAGNKWITVIQNLEQFSLDPRDFAHRLQIAVAASTTVGEGPNAKAGLQVTVQGNQLKFLEKFLTGHYQIHRRYIEGLQQTTKGKGKR